MVEKRKNSDKRNGISLGFALLLLLGGLFAGMNLGVSSSNDAVLTEASVSVTTFEGEWIGTITEDYGAESRYDFRITLDNTTNTNGVVGMSYLDMAQEPEIYSESPIEGFVIGDEIFLSQVSTTVLENVQMDNWCLADITLSYQVLNGQETLVGTWTNAHFERVECDGISGRVILTRQSD
ncbi:MAG: hypothetical protein AAF846_03835 [Chloroflexota bacterium]